MSLYKSLIAVAVSTSLALGGCASTSAFGGSSADPDPRLANDDFNVESSSYITACATGAAITGIGCILLVDSNQRAACIAAAAAGCAVFMGGNALLDKLRSDYHSKEQQLDALLANMQSNNQKAIDMAAAAQAVYADDQKRMAKLQRDIKNHTAQKQELQQTIAQYDANIELLQDNLEVHLKSLDSYKTARNGIVNGQYLTKAEKQRLKECDQEIAELQQAVDDLRQSLEGYINARNVLAIGLEQQPDVA